jgi:hypothetical protein
MKLHDTGTIPTIVNGRISVSRSDKVNTKRAIKINKCDSATPRNKDHKILIIGDSHTRNCASNVKLIIKDNFKVQGIVKPGAGADILASPMTNEI